MLDCLDCGREMLKIGNFFYCVNKKCKQPDDIPCETCGKPTEFIPEKGGGRWYCRNPLCADRDFTLEEVKSGVAS
jgi:hypothetical protein